MTADLVVIALYLGMFLGLALFIIMNPRDRP